MALEEAAVGGEMVRTDEETSEETVQSTRSTDSFKLEIFKLNRSDEFFDLS